MPRNFPFCDAPMGFLWVQYPLTDGWLRLFLPRSSNGTCAVKRAGMREVWSRALHPESPRPAPPPMSDQAVRTTAETQLAKWEERFRDRAARSSDGIIV